MEAKQSRGRQQSGVQPHWSHTFCNRVPRLPGMGTTSTSGRIDRIWAARRDSSSRPRRPGSAETPRADARNTADDGRTPVLGGTDGFQELRIPESRYSRTSRGSARGGVASTRPSGVPSADPEAVNGDVRGPLQQGHFQFVVNKPRGVDARNPRDSHSAVGPRWSGSPGFQTGGAGTMPEGSSEFPRSGPERAPNPVAVRRVGESGSEWDEAMREKVRLTQTPSDSERWPPGRGRGSGLGRAHG